MKELRQRTVRDPVCGRRLNPDRTFRFADFKGQRYFFCSPGCRDAFGNDPRKYLKSKGFFSRFLDRLARANEEEFGGRPPGCH